MSRQRAKVGISCTRAAWERYFVGEPLERLRQEAEVVLLDFEGGARDSSTPTDAAAIARLRHFVADLDVLVVSYGSPRVTEEVMACAPKLRMIGDTHGDRFASRVDVEGAKRRGIVLSDTTNASSYPVAEWALALVLIGLRNAGDHFRRLVAGELLWPDREVFRSDPGYLLGELHGKTVGLIGAGTAGQQLISLLQPFGVALLVNDPGAPDVLASVFDLELTSLDNVMAFSDVVVSLVPLTSSTRGMIGADQFELLRSGAVFVNVSRGAVVDTAALVDRLRRGDIIACLDVVEPEPLAVGSPLRSMPNVFLSPHIAGVTVQSEPRFFELMVDEVTRVLKGHRARYPLLPREPFPMPQRDVASLGTPGHAGDGSIGPGTTRNDRPLYWSTG
jgi:phosphoglycerate dehydrogenase-like enzyme